LHWQLPFALGILTGCQVLFPLDQGLPDGASPDDAVVCVGIDLQTDREICGRCGHDCHGGGCEEGACQPARLAMTMMTPSNLVVSATHVYWLEGGAILRTLKTGGPVATFREPGGATGLGADLTDLYWLDPAGLKHCPLDNCASPTLVPDTRNCNGVARQVVISQGWIAHSCPVSNEVFWVTKASSSRLKIGAFGELRGLASETEDVFIADRQAGQIFRSVDGGLAQLFVANADTARVDALAIDSTNLYWTANEKVGMTIRETKTSIVLAPAMTPEAIAVGGPTVFFLGGRNQGYVRACGIAGCDQVSQELASGIDNPVEIAVDEADIYFLTSPGGPGNGVWKLAR